MRWNALHAQKLKNEIHPHENDRTRDRRLRIGYVGADFREHCQSLFTIPLLSNHDRKNFEVFCYAHVSRPDATTERIRGYCDGWRSIVGMRDDEVAKKIRDDRIDILVDLTMHMSLGRSLVFARKPAPVQAAWLAYPGTTGLSAMDYRLTDPYLDPPSTGSGQAGTRDHDYCETSIRLADTFWCYDPLCEELEIGDAPAIRNGYITFGCLNNFCKARPKTLELWARILSAAPNSRLDSARIARGPSAAAARIFSAQGNQRRPNRFCRIPGPARIFNGLSPDRHRPGHAPVQWPHDKPGFNVDGGAGGHVRWENGRGPSGMEPVVQSRPEAIRRPKRRRVCKDCHGIGGRSGSAGRIAKDVAREDEALAVDGREEVRASVESAYREMWETYCATKPERS